MKIDRDFILRIAQFLWGSSLTKLGSSIAIIGAIALTGTLVETIIAVVFAAKGQPSPISQIPPWIGFGILFLGIAAASLGAYWQRPQLPRKNKPNPHDVRLIEEFRRQFTEPQVNFLRAHNFWGSFPSNALDNVFEVAAWRGAAYEFTDEEIEALFEQVKLRSDELASIAELKTWPHRVAHGRHTALPDNYDEWNPDPITIQAVSNLNDAARNLVLAVDAFERVARRKIPTLA